MGKRLKLSVCSVSRASKKDPVYKKLGLAEPPKRPAHAYNLFFKETCATIPLGVNAREQCNIIAQKWKQLPEDEKSKYSDQHKRLHALYYDQLRDYEKNLTEEDERRIAEERDLAAKVKVRSEERRVRLAEQRSRGHPSAPRHSFLLFVEDQSRAAAGEGVSFRLTDAAKIWNQLDEQSKKVYTNRSKELRKNYEKELKNWEKSMVSAGRPDLVRTRTRRQRDTKDNGERPTRPAGPSLLFMHQRRAEEPALSRKALGELWRSLDAEGRRPYQEKYARQMEAYETDLRQYEARMIEEGKTSRVRKNSLNLLTKRSDKKKESLKNDFTEKAPTSMTSQE